MTPERKEWLLWRKGGIGSSDAAVVMGVSPYQTIRQLYEDKINPEVHEEESNWAMEIGNEMEPRARNHFAALYSIENGVDEPFSARLVTMKDFPFLRASLDGCSRDQREILEIKYQGALVHEAVRDHKMIPEKYYPQVQHGLMVSAADVNHFVSINESFDVQHASIKPDLDYIKLLMEAELKFWGHVLLRNPPPLSDGDFKSLRYKGAAEDVRAWLGGIPGAAEAILKQASAAGGRYHKLKGAYVMDGVITKEIKNV